MCPAIALCTAVWCIPHRNAGSLPKFYPLICSFVWLQRCKLLQEVPMQLHLIGDLSPGAEVRMFLPPPRRAAPPTKREQPPPSAEMLAKVRVH